MAWGIDDFLVLSVLYGNPQTVLISTGILRDLERDPLPILRLCNERNHANPAYCFFLHDAEAGWDVILQLSYPLQLLIDVPPFLEASLEPTVRTASEARNDFAGLGLGGESYQWNEQDRERLLMRSMV